MNSITLLLDASLTSTSSRSFLGSTEQNCATASGTVIASEAAVPAEKDRREGRLPRHLASHRREQNDAAYRGRKERARQALAAEVSDLGPQTLARLRLSRGISQVRLAEMIRTSQPHIARIEAGGRLYWDTAVRIADALNVSLDELRPLVQMEPMTVVSDKYRLLGSV